MNSSDKTRLRNQVWWRALRKRKIEEVKARDKDGKLRCELTGVWIQTESRANCHHRFPDDYASEDLDHYRILSASAHDFVEWLATIKRSSIPRKDLMEAWLSEFLPVVERKTEKLYAMIKEDVAKKREML